MSVSDDLNIIKQDFDGERVAGAIVSAIQTLNNEIYTEADVSEEISTIGTSIYGREVKAAIHDGLEKLSVANPSHFVPVTSLTQAAYDDLDPPATGVLYGISEESAIKAYLLDEYFTPTGQISVFFTLGELRLFLNENEDSLYHVKIGSMLGIDSISEGYFAGRLALYSIELGTNVKTIYGLAFNGATNLTSVIISSGTNRIDPDAFANCDGVDFTINKPLNSIDGYPWGATNASVTWTE